MIGRSINILIIDDERNFRKVERLYKYHRVDYARNLIDAQDMLQTGEWDFVYLDHDLGGEEKVSTLTSQIEEMAYAGHLLNIKKFVIHSTNPVGRKEMYEALHKFYNVEFAQVEDLL